MTQDIREGVRKAQEVFQERDQGAFEGFHEACCEQSGRNMNTLAEEAEELPRDRPPDPNAYEQRAPVLAFH